KPAVRVRRAGKEAAALAGLERWKARHPEAATHLRPADVLIDAMRGRSSTWTRVRVNLEHVPEGLRPAEEPLDPDDPPAVPRRGDFTSASFRRSRRARREE